MESHSGETTKTIQLTWTHEMEHDPINRVKEINDLWDYTKPMLKQYTQDLWNLILEGLERTYCPGYKKKTLHLKLKFFQWIIQASSMSRLLTISQQNERALETQYLFWCIRPATKEICS